MELVENSTVKIGSSRSFGITFSILFLLITAFLFLSELKILGLFASVLSLMFLLFSIKSPSIFDLPNQLWFRLGMVLGKILPPMILAIIFFVVITPMGVFFKIRLKPGRKGDKNSYWKTRKIEPGTMKYRF